MVYECKKCKATLPPGVSACPQCGDRFNAIVPADAQTAPDAQTATEGWQSKAESGTTSAQPVPLAAPNPQQTIPDGLPRSGKTQPVRKAIEAMSGSLYGKSIKQNPLLAAVGVVAALIVLIALVRPHTASYVFEQHPTYQANMASFIDRARVNQVDYVWPYAGHEDRLQVIAHPNSYGNTSAALPSKKDMDIAAVTARLGFCVVRYRSGFTPDAAMQCQVYVLYDGSPDTGYDGPEVSPDRDATVKAKLDQIQ